MKHTLLIITALILIVGCSEPINFDELVEIDGIFYTKDTNKPYSGKAVEYLENGQKYYEVTFKDGKADGKVTEWHENGQKELEATFKDGEYDGLWTAWDENGQKREEGTFKDGIPDGKATGWYENGQKSGEITYKNGAVISEKCWDEDGNEIGCG